MPNSLNKNNNYWHLHEVIANNSNALKCFREKAEGVQT